MTGPAPRLLEAVRAELIRSGAELSPGLVAQVLRNEPGAVVEDAVLAVHDALRRDLDGAGPLQPLLQDPAVTDVLVNGADQVWVDRGRGLVQVPLAFADEAAVRGLAQRLAAQAGRRLDDAVPFVDARLLDGTRLHAVLAPLARPGTLISLRRAAPPGFDLDELRRRGAIDGAGADLIAALIQRRVAFLISGGTGSGKTTFLNAVLGLVAAEERIVVVEDSAELRPAHQHVVSLEGRPANLEGAGAVTLRDLVRQALRMRPDRIVVGEVRGAEVIELLGALNTGHEGGCGTVHANSAESVPLRIESLALAGGLSREAAMAQLAGGVDVVLHLARDRAGVRRLAQIGVVVADGGGRTRVVSAVRFAGGARELGPGAARLEELLAR